MTGRKRAAVAAAIVTGCIGSATALGADHTAPGTAGEAGCVGQSQAFFAQLGQNYGEGIPHGVGGVAKFLDVTPGDLHASSITNCAVNP